MKSLSWKVWAPTSIVKTPVSALYFVDELGVYVVCSKENKSMTDFSQDSIYLQMLNEIIKLKYYIEERIKDKRI